MKNCLILGSGRSGTSMLAGTLYKAGYYMGDDLYPPRESNPKGFFENKFINGINEKIIIETRRKNAGIMFPYPPLREGQLWLDVLPLDVKFYSTSIIAKKIKEAIKKEPFCYKDPRFSYTYPIWKRYLSEHINLIIFREPSVTAESIIKECNRMKYLEDVDMTFQRAIQIWKHMYLHILKNYRKEKNWIFIHYEQLFDENVISFLEEKLSATLDKSFPDLSLKRTISNKKVSKDVEEIYRKLCELASYKQRAFINLSENKKNEVKEKENFYIKMDIELLLKKRNLTDKEIFRLSHDYLKLKNSKKAKEWLDKLIKRGTSKELVFNLLLKLMDFGERDFKIDIVYKYLNFMVKKKKKTALNKYHIASMYKKIGRFSLSKKWFFKVLEEADNKDLIAGAYFHVGEIEYEKNDWKKAMYYFKKCIEFNPYHRKAKNYVENIRDEK